MSILDKKHILTINLDDSSIEYSKKIFFYNTDKNISNLYVKIKKNNDDGVGVELSANDLNDVTVKLTAIKPKTNQTREMTGILTEELTDQSCAIYKFELLQEFTDQVGSVICEFELSNASGEKVTIDAFSYKIKSSKLTGLNAEIESNPDLPVLKALIEEVKETAQTVNNIDNVNVSDIKTYSNKKIEEKFKGVNAQFNTIESKNNSIFINVLYPPVPLTALKNDGVTDNSGKLSSIIEFIKVNNTNATIFFPSQGKYFMNKVRIDLPNIDLTIYGDNSKIVSNNQFTEADIFSIININNISVKGIDFEVMNIIDGFDSNIVFLGIYNANIVNINSINTIKTKYTLKINWTNTADINMQNVVNKLITNNITASNVRGFMHVCNIKSWNGYNLDVNMSFKTNINPLNVAFYMRTRCNNVNLSNIKVLNCSGAVFHFNRKDYTGGLIDVPLGTSGFEDTNININNIICENIGRLLDFNSETYNISINNCKVKNQTNKGAIIYVYQGKCDTLLLNNFECDDIERLIYFEDGNAGVDNIIISNGVIKGKLKSLVACYGNVGNITFSNICFKEIDSDLNTGSILFRFYGTWKVINLNNIDIYIGTNVNRVTDCIRFGSNTIGFTGKVYINNFNLIRPVKNDYDVIAFAFGIVTNTFIKIDNSSVENANLFDSNVNYSITKVNNCFVSNLGGKKLVNMSLSSYPTTGEWTRGEIIYNSTPSIGTYLGWICVESGTPGIWKGFGLIN